LSETPVRYFVMGGLGDIWALPPAVLGPELLRQPWNWHFWVLLTFKAGRPHCSPVRFDFAVHRAHTTLPPAVTRRFVMLFA
jgi:hypothetical protein